MRISQFFIYFFGPKWAITTTGLTLEEVKRRALVANWLRSYFYLATIKTASQEQSASIEKRLFFWLDSPVLLSPPRCYRCVA